MTGAKTPKQIFIEEVDRLFQANEVDSAARGVLYSMKKQERDRVGSTKVRSSERADSTKSAILEILRSSNEPLNREDIAEQVGGDITPNSISAYATQLVASGEIKKSSQRYAKGRTQVVYSIA